MVTYGIFKNDDNDDVFMIVSLTKLVNEVMKEKDFDYVTAIVEVASLVDTNYIISDTSDEKIIGMFPNAKIVAYDGGDID